MGSTPSSSSGAAAHSQMMSLPDEAGMPMRMSQPTRTAPPKPNMLDLRKTPMQKGGVIRGPAGAGPHDMGERSTMGSRGAADVSEFGSERNTYGSRPRTRQRKNSVEDTGRNTPGERRTIGSAIGSARAQRKASECSDDTTNSLESGGPRRPSSPKTAAAAAAAARLDTINSSRPMSPLSPNSSGAGASSSGIGGGQELSPHAQRRARDLQPLELDRSTPKPHLSPGGSEGAAFGGDRPIRTTQRKSTTGANLQPLDHDRSTPKPGAASSSDGGAMTATNSGDSRQHQHRKSNAGFSGSVAAAFAPVTNAAAKGLALLGTNGGDASGSHGGASSSIVPTPPPAGAKAGQPSPAPRKVVTKKLRPA